MLTAIGSIFTHLSTYQWYNINNRINHFFDYVATYPGSKITYQKINMHIWVHIDTSYLAEPKARSRAGGYHYFSNKTKLTSQFDDPLPKHNHPVLVLSKVIGAIITSTQEYKTVGDYINSKESLPIRLMAIEMGHPRGLTPLQFNNKCAHVILTRLLKQKRYKGMDMRFYWLCDRSIE